jgi:acyl carrier protein
VVFESLATVAPEIETATVNPDVSLRDQTDLDSMDFLRFVIELHRRLAVEVPETDYSKMATVTSAVDYLMSRLDTVAR